MRRILPILLVAVVAFAAGAAGANGAFSRLFPEPKIGADATATPTSSGILLPTATLTSGTSGTSAPAATASGATATPLVVTATPTSTRASTKVPSATPTATPVPIGAPLALHQLRAGGAALAQDGWANGAGLTLQVLAPSGATGLRAEVEVRPAGQPFTGSPTGMALVQQGTASVAVHGLPSGHYHWQARLASSSSANTGPWAAYAHDATAFGVQTTPPPAPVISSPSNPNPDRVYGTSVITMKWTAPSDPSGIAGYSYRLDTDPHSAALASVRTQAQQVSLYKIDTGVYYFHVRALDGAGNWGSSATYTVHIDVTPPSLTQHQFSGYYLNPSVESLTMTYTLDKVSHVTVGIYDTAGTRVRHFVFKDLKLARVQQSFAWDGRDNDGKLVPAGSYSVYLRATDRLGNSGVVGWSGFTVTDKLIKVSLSQQRLWGYEGNKAVFNTLVTTGNPLLPTPTGLFHIIFKQAPFTFRSTWPKTSMFWYPPSPVKFAMYFDAPGYFIHDAPWRGFFGPGSNTVPGKPGGNQTGTHGCVNVPSNVMAQIYAWAPSGTPVQVVQ